MTTNNAVTTHKKHIIVLADNPLGEKLEMICQISEAHKIARDLYGPNYSLQIKPASDKAPLLAPK